MDDRIRELVNQYHVASTEGDLAFMTNITSNSPEALLLGSDPNEIVTGHDNIVTWWQGLFDFLESIGYPNGGLPVIAPTNLQVGHQGGVAWAVEQATWQFVGGDVPFRISLVFKKEGNAWKIIQQHFSIGVANSELPLE
jgi:ketosteroid isomerase-like protein